MQPFFVFTAEQRTAAMAFSNPQAGLTINPRLMDGASPGTGTNVNGLAQCTVPVDDPVALSGKYASSYAIFSDAEYLRVVPDMVTYVLTMPVCELDRDVIFPPAGDGT